VWREYTAVTLLYSRQIIQQAVGLFSKRPESAHPKLAAAWTLLASNCWYRLVDGVNRHLTRQEAFGHIPGRHSGASEIRPYV